MSKKMLRLVLKSDTNTNPDGGTQKRTIFTTPRFDATTNPFLFFRHFLFENSIEAHASSATSRDYPYGVDIFTLVFSGKLEQHDSSGIGGLIGPGEIQRVSTGDGLVLHERVATDNPQSKELCEYVQFGIALPHSNKKLKSHFARISWADKPVELLDDGQSTSQLYKDQPISATSVRLRELDLNTGIQEDFDFSDNQKPFFLVREGHVQVNNGELLEKGDLAIFCAKGTTINIRAIEPSKLLLVDGKPISRYRRLSPHDALIVKRVKSGFKYKSSD